MEQENSPAHPVAPDTTGAAPPHATRKTRHNEWTRAKMARFLEVLAETASVTTAAESVGMSRQSAYRVRSRLIGHPFDLAWDGALEFGIQQVAHAALDRALNGTVVPIFYKGEQVGERRVFNERAVMNLMTSAQNIGRDPEARENASSRWFRMIHRIESGPIVWTEDDVRNNPLHPLYTGFDEDDGDDQDEYWDEAVSEGEFGEFPEAQAEGGSDNRQTGKDACQ
jgi:hypothetical protein